MRGVHVKLLIQFFICHKTLQIFRQRSCQIIVNFCMFLSVNCRNQKYRKNQQKNRKPLCHETGNSSKIRQNCFMSCFFQRFVKNQDHRRKYGYTSNNTKYHAFCHNDSKIFTQGKTHETQCNKSGNRRDGTSHNRSNGL